MNSNCPDTLANASSRALDIIRASAPSPTTNVPPAKPGWTQDYLDKFVTADPAMLEVKRKVGILAAVDDPVLIIGPTGTGKELIAHALHGIRHPDKFMAINCAAMPENLLESELFGHVRGAFTGATEDKPGLFKLANKGTLFLDEIGDMSLSLQAKLLRVLQDKRIRKVGGKEFEYTTARIVAATNQDIASKLINKHLFREDLYYRLCVFELKLTPLCEREGDVALILKQLDSTLDCVNLDKLKLAYPKFTGNVRLLEALVKRHKILGEAL